MDGYTVHDSKKNIRLNRYGDVQPYDHSRVKLQRKTFDYINANIVKVRRYTFCIMKSREESDPLHIKHDYPDLRYTLQFTLNLI